MLIMGGVQIIGYTSNLVFHSLNLFQISTVWLTTYFGIYLRLSQLNQYTSENLSCIASGINYLGHSLYPNTTDCSFSFAVIKVLVLQLQFILKSNSNLLQLTRSVQLDTAESYQIVMTQIGYKINLFSVSFLRILLLLRFISFIFIT